MNLIDFVMNMLSFASIIMKLTYDNYVSTFTD